jgi:polysaccharide export outer membrane protein
MKLQNSRGGQLLVSGLLCICAVAAQGQARLSSAKPSGAAAESLLIGAGDLVHVTVFRMPDLETKARVTDAGDVTLPLVGKVHIAGLTPAEASRTVEQQYEAGHYLVEPQVSVLVEEYVTQTVAILGEVQRPGTFPAATARGVMDTLALAGGFTPAADRHITVQHGSGQKQEVFLPNDAKDALAADVLVYPGDLVIVPKAGIVYVLGDVGRPGGYVMQEDSTLTVMQAIAMASGANRTAKEGSAIVVRKTAAGYKEIPVSLKDMQKGKIADMALEREDVLWVPFSYGKNLVITGSSIVAGASSAVVYHY